MPLYVHLALISIIQDADLIYEKLDTDNVIWSTPPPKFLPAFQFKRCLCHGPASGFQVKLKYGGLIIWIDVTSWGLTYRKSTPTRNGIEITTLSTKSPYRLEVLFL